jgi:hypothetical protein
VNADRSARLQRNVRASSPTWSSISPSATLSLGNAAVRAYYGGSDLGRFFAQINSVLRNNPLLLPLQVVRAMLCTALAIPVIRMMKGQWWETGLAGALVFAVMSSQLLLANPHMPQEFAWCIC